jgi:hypothetical protein
MFSTSMIASSTTSPIAIARAAEGDRVQRRARRVEDEDGRQERERDRRQRDQRRPRVEQEEEEDERHEPRADEESRAQVRDRVLDERGPAGGAGRERDPLRLDRGPDLRERRLDAPRRVPSCSRRTG